MLRHGGGSTHTHPITRRQGLRRRSAAGPRRHLQAARLLLERVDQVSSDGGEGTTVDFWYLGERQGGLGGDMSAL